MPDKIEIECLPRKDIARRAADLNEGGACNPRAMARELVRAIDVVCVEGRGHPAAGQSPEVRLILHQLFWVLYKLDLYVEFDRNASAGRFGSWEKDIAECRRLQEDPTAHENVRRQRAAELNSNHTERAELEARHGQVWDTEELGRDFEVQGFAAPFVLVTRKADGRDGSLEFQQDPRYYFNFQEKVA